MPGLETGNWELETLLLDIRRRTGLLFFAVTMGHVVLISAQVQSKSGVPVLQTFVFDAFSRVQGAFASMLHGTRYVWGNYVALRGVRAENEWLRSQVSDLEVRLQQERAQAARAAKLQELLDLRSGSSLSFLAAEVIAGHPSPGMQTLTINRGRADGVLADMAVVAPKGIVGRVIGEPASHAAIVQLLIDRSAAAGALIERTRAGGMVVGTERDPPLAMDLVSNLADVKPGDVVVASGVDGIYPKGFAIGRVQTAERGPNLYQKIGVRPLVDFSSIEEVLVVLEAPHGAVPAEPPAERAPSVAGPPK